MSLFVEETRDFTKLRSEILKIYFSNRCTTYSEQTNVMANGILHSASPDNMAILLTIEQFINKKFEELKVKK